MSATRRGPQGVTVEHLMEAGCYRPPDPGYIGAVAADDWYARGVIGTVTWPGDRVETSTASTIASETDATLDRLLSMRAHCVRIRSRAKSDLVAGASFQMFLAAAHRRDLRVLVQVGAAPAKGAAGWRRQLDLARSWCELGTDGVVLPSPLLPGAECWVGHELERRCFVSVDDTPVPLASTADALDELGYFRAALTDTIVDSIRRRSGIPLLGLIVRLAMGIVRRHRGEDVGMTPFARGSGTGTYRRALAAIGAPAFEGTLVPLLCALPGPLLLPDAQWNHGRLTGEMLERTIVPLVARRDVSTALRYGCVCPVGVGAGPVLAFIREWNREVVLVVANLDTEQRDVTCDLGGYEHSAVDDLAGTSPFPPVREAVYSVRMAPHSCHWLRLVRETDHGEATCSMGRSRARLATV